MALAILFLEDLKEIGLNTFFKLDVFNNPGWPNYRLNFSLLMNTISLKYTVRLRKASQRSLTSTPQLCVPGPSAEVGPHVFQLSYACKSPHVAIGFEIGTER